MSQVLDLPHPYLLFLGDTTEKGYAKTAFGLRDWAPDRCVGEWSCAGATVTTDLPRLTPKEARARGARALVIGVANTGGVIGDSWIPSLLEALESGLDLISGMHAKLGNVPQLKAAAERHGRRLIDVRTPPKNIPIATGAKRSGKRLLTVGTDCAVGKKYTALALARAFTAARARRGLSRHGTDGNLDRGRRHADGRGGCRFRGRRRGNTESRGTRAALGRDRRAGLLVPPGLRRCFARPAARQPAGCDRGVP